MQHLLPLVVAGWHPVTQDLNVVGAHSAIHLCVAVTQQQRCWRQEHHQAACRAQIKRTHCVMFTTQATTTALALSGWLVAATTIALYFRTQRKEKLADPHEQLRSVDNTRPDPYSAAPRSNHLSWDDYFMSIAFLSAQRSKDPSKQVGACIVNEEHVIVSIGYNGFPRGCHDHALPWAKKACSGSLLDTKYPYVVHAEANALLNKNAAKVAGTRIYVTLFPCNECAKLLIQAGINEVIFNEAKFDLSLLNSSSDLRSTSQLRPSRHNSSSSSSGVRLADCSGGTQQRDQSSSCAGDAACGGSQVTRTSAGTPDLDMAVSSGLTAAAAAAGVAADTAAAAADGNAAAAAADARPNAVAEAGKEEYLASLRLLRMAGVKLRQHHISRAVTLGQPA